MSYNTETNIVIDFRCNTIQFQERRSSVVVVSTSAWHAAGRRFDSWIKCKNLALNIRDCLSLCLSEETLKAVGPFYLVSMPGEVKDPKLWPHL